MGANMPLRFDDWATGERLTESQAFSRVEEYQVAREEVADRLDYAVDRYLSAVSSRSEQYWDRQVSSLRAELSGYDAALGGFQEQFDSVYAPDETDADDEDEGSEWDEWDDPSGGLLDDYFDDWSGDYPDWWFEEADEWEFGVDYGEVD